MSAARSHDWAIRRLTAFSIGLLPEDETIELEEHMVSCVDCRARLESIAPGPGRESVHLPASLIATWPRAARALLGIERELVAGHLKRCASCRATLEFVGHEAVLPELVPAGPIRLPVTPRARRVWAWSLGLSGAAAGVIAWILATQPGSFPLGPGGGSTSATMGSARDGAPASVTFELAVDSLAAGSVLLPEPGFRGDPVREVDLGAVTSISGAVLVVPPSLRPPSAEDGGRMLTLALLRDGREVAMRATHFYELGDAFRLRPIGRLEAGVYELRVALAPAAADERPLVWFYRLRVR
jgi:hypothetical protein